MIQLGARPPRPHPIARPWKREGRQSELVGHQRNGAARERLLARAPIPALVRVAVNLAGATSAAWFAQASFAYYLHTHRLIGGLFLVEQAWFAGAFLFRRPAQTVSPAPEQLATGSGRYIRRAAVPADRSSPALGRARRIRVATCRSCPRDRIPGNTGPVIRLRGS